MISTVFLGTEKFAAYILEQLINSKSFEFKMIFTQPDRPVGRHQTIQKSPVKLVAEKYNLPIAQPETLKKYEWPISNYDLNIVVEYGLLIPSHIIEAPRFKTINVHPSLLPKYRGASPIQSALLNGETTTGTSIMIIDDQMDHGPILAQKTLPIANDDDYSTLTKKLVKISADLLLQTVPEYLSKKITPRVQNENDATFCKIFKKEDGLINFQKTAHEIYNQFRAFSDWPGIYIIWNGKRLKLLSVQPIEKEISAGQVKIDHEKIYIGSAKQSLEILRLQLEGKKPMSAKEFLHGYKNIDGYVF